MAFITGLFLLDAPASALNNAGGVSDDRFDNKVAVKVIRTREGIYPYVSAQAFRYWLRTTLEQANVGWMSAPVYREDKVAYTDADPIKWWDDDLFGYMRSPSDSAGAKKKRQEDPEYKKLTSLQVKDGKELTITRAAPFRVSTLVSIAPMPQSHIVEDWEAMTRCEGDQIPYSNQFYRATLKGLFSLDMKASGTFWYRQKTGFRNLDDVRIEKAEKAGLIHLEAEKAYRLPLDQRIRRVAALFEGMAVLDGGAKQTLHYTDVAPPLVIMAVTKGGNHVFGYVAGATGKGLPELKIEALKEALSVFEDEILSDVYVGWVRGYLDEDRAKLEEFARTTEGSRVKIRHPREAFKALVEALKDPDKAASWME
ncbi:MAG: type I-B CRISPR-associated protein Cas7/Cst2/DevR [Bacillota bacterium]|jgi:CRISPR-associated protein Cst2|nr:MAG: type I-B CRISPR-associated protein Cas7/Cst2/DevR [Ammonifex sp.]